MNIASPSGKKFEVFMRSKIRGFDGIVTKSPTEKYKKKTLERMFKFAKLVLFIVALQIFKGNVQRFQQVQS